MSGALVALVLLTAASEPAAEPVETMSLRDVEPGRRGVAVTVIEGDETVEMDVEFVGRLEDALGPGQDLLLARLRGEDAEFHGVAAGMSGSPVYVDGKLVGAVGYSYGAFTKEAVAGITPIEQMLSPPAPRAVRPAADPLASPLVTVGVPGPLRKEYDDAWRSMGFEPMDGAVGVGGDTAGSLRPGSPVAAVLVSGDAMVASVGTVTHVDGNEIWAFGHSFQGEGRVDVPMAHAEVLMTVASWAGSWKLSEIGDVVGAFRQDRLTGVRGTVGARAVTVPLEVVVRRAEGPARSRFEIMQHRSFTPTLVSMMVASSLWNSQDFEADESYRITGEARFAAGGHLELDFMQSNPAASQVSPFLVGREVSRRLAEASTTPFGDNPLASVSLEVLPVLGGAAETLEDLAVDRLEIRPGESVAVTAYLRDTAGRRRTVRSRLTVPAGVPPGEIELHAGAETTLEAAFGARAEARRRSARTREAWLEALRRDPRAHGLVMRLAGRAQGALVGGREYPGLPDTIRRTLASTRDGSRGFALPRTLLAEVREETGATVLGASTIKLRVVGAPGRNR